MAGLYVHFPFCAAKCIYCDFYSRVRQDWAPYIEALLREISDRKNERVKMPGHAGHDVIVPTTLYFGGGTPSFLPAATLVKVADEIRRTFGLSDPPGPATTSLSAPAGGGRLEEFTVEVNPDDVTADKAAALRAAGATRISMGIQSFDDGHLQI